MHIYGHNPDTIGAKCRIVGSAETAGIYGGDMFTRSQI